MADQQKDREALPAPDPRDYREGECHHELRREWCAICSPPDAQPQRRRGPSGTA
ncbi:MAG: hypothetical protein ACRDJF_10870 [Actinomycetota bacterium]